jgi:hypothetical protein
MCIVPVVAAGAQSASVARSAAQVAGNVGLYVVPDTAGSAASEVGCVFSGGKLQEVRVPAPRVQMEQRWRGVFRSQFVKWTAAVQVKQSRSWFTLTSLSRTAAAHANGYTPFRAISPFSGRALDGSAGAAYRVVDTLSWLNPGVRGRQDGRVTYVAQDYRYNYPTGHRSDCQDQAPKSNTASTGTIYLGGSNNSVQVLSHDPDGDSPLSVSLVRVMLDGSPVTGIASLNGTSIAFFPVAGDVGDTITVQYEITDPGGAQSGIQTLSETVASGTGPTSNPAPTPSTPVPTPTPTPTPTTPSPTPTATVTATPTPTATTPTATPTSAPGQMAAPAASDHAVSGVGYNGAIQVTYTDPPPNTGTLAQIEYSFNGATTNGSWTPSSPGLSQTQTLYGLTNGTSYVVYLRACNSTSVCGAWSPPSVSATPYTVPRAPSASASANGLSVTYSWSGGGGGGRAIAHYTVCVDGTCSQQPAASTSTQTYTAYSTPHSLSVTLVDTAGQTSAAGTASATTGTQPVQQPTPHYESTGGESARTWSNPATAGGTQGPSVPTYTTVQVTCRIEGYRVPDGDDWWYRVASSPWNNAYYLTADVTYNNGATTGSINDGVLVDATVPLC